MNGLKHNKNKRQDATNGGRGEAVISTTIVLLIGAPQIGLSECGLLFIRSRIEQLHLPMRTEVRRPVGLSFVEMLHAAFRFEAF